MFSDDDMEAMDPPNTEGEEEEEEQRKGKQQEPSSLALSPAAESPAAEDYNPAVSGDQMDVEAYASLYKGRTKVLRLFFIAEHCRNQAMELEALRMAHEEIRKGESTSLYKEVCEKINGRLGPAFLLDQEWVDAVDRRSAQRLERLETELNGYKTNLIKESIRMGYNDLGDFHSARGDLQQAFKCFVRTRDYCTTSKHIISMCLNVILVAINLGQFHHVSNYVAKAEQTPDNQEPQVMAKLRVDAGLAYLENQKYKLAARKFVDTSFDLGATYNEVIAPQDVATYGGLCALASFDRAELKSKVIDNINFKNFLELVPEVRELIHDFYASRYASCLGYLQKLKTNLLLDIHLHDHVESLYTLIRHKALIQYTTPFISVDLNRMADAFKTSVAGLEKELAALIMENQIQARIDSHNKILKSMSILFAQARIDSHNKILHARHADQRNGTFQRALQTGSDFERDARAMLVRANLLKHEIVVRGSARK